MSKTLYISTKNLPIRPFTIPTVAIVALLKAYEVPKTVWAVAITLLVVVWVSVIAAVILTDTVELDVEKLAQDYRKKK